MSARIRARREILSNSDAKKSERESAIDRSWIRRGQTDPFLV